MGALLACLSVRAADATGPSKYTGPGSCSSPACHGGVQPRDQTTVLQNEYSVWVVRDKHAHAFVNLTNPVGTRIAKLMGLPSPDTAPRCLACHALDVSEDQRARTFDLTDGVGCENCHGPASAWLGPHTTRGWKYEKSLELGLYDTRDLVKRSEKCLTCHLGTAEKSVDHELIAAGHPDLYFELDSFMSVMPPHWNEVDKDPWFPVRAMGVGQAVQLREQLKRVARESQGGIWPEYAELDCFACHHNLVAAKDSWRQERGYPGRKPGNPPFNLSRFVVLNHVIQDADPGAARDLKADIDQVYAGVTALNSNRAQVAAQATSTAEVAGRLATRLNAMKFDQSQTLRLMKNISGDSSIADQGERAAEQATMALDSLFIAYSKNGKLANDAQIRAGINGLFRQLDDPSSYDAFKFAAAMKSLNALIE
ncbi:MAG TPA: multiheme c-type cytochrome [Bryobacteraceae bacterium]|nr:multiheme c-type cytochrome [Bryobacteraceae bacterium]